jgi:hypothetical protein
MSERVVGRPFTTHLQEEAPLSGEGVRLVLARARNQAAHRAKTWLQDRAMTRDVFGPQALQVFAESIASN